MYDELLFRKNVGLVRGDIIGDLSKQEALTIFNLTKEFYTIGHLYEEVNKFNKDPDRFNYEEHVNKCLQYYH